MQQATKCRMIFSAFLAVLVLAGAAAAEGAKTAAKPEDRATLDESIYQSLRGIIDHGADLYNQGDWNGCYHLWEGALMSLKPLMGERQIQSWTKAASNDNAVYVDSLKSLQSQLGDRPGLKKVIDTALAAAQQTPQIYRRAFILRVVLDQLRAETKPAKETAAQERKPSGAEEAKKTQEEKREEKKREEKKKEKKPAGKASITGLVTLKGQPLKGGTVIFTNAEAKAEGKIAADGTYKVEGVEPGDYTVSFQGVKGVAIPAVYGNPKKTPVKISVKQGKQNADFVLK